jgi:hypothetical protein
MDILLILLYLAGGFAVILGVLHFTFPRRFGFFAVLPSEGPALDPFRLLFYRYEMKYSDLRGLIYIMNHCVSYTILMIGIFDLFASRWLGTVAGSLVSIAVAGFWAVRAGTQFYLGIRKGDLAVVAFFLSFSALHVVAALQGRM